MAGKMKSRLVCGVAKNDSDIIVSKRFGDNARCRRITDTPYLIWMNLLLACYSDAYRKSNNIDDDSTVCAEWIDSFETFREWYVSNKTEGYQLFNRALDYQNDRWCPEKTIFAPLWIHRLFYKTRRDKIEGTPTGVIYLSSTGRYKYSFSCRGKMYVQKTAKTLEEAVSQYVYHRLEWLETVRYDLDAVHKGIYPNLKQMYSDLLNSPDP